MNLPVLALDARPYTVGKPNRKVDIDSFHVSLAHANEALLRATAEQRGSCCEPPPNNRSCRRRK